MRQDLNCKKENDASTIKIREAEIRFSIASLHRIRNSDVIIYQVREEIEKMFPELLEKCFFYSFHLV